MTAVPYEIFMAMCVWPQYKSKRRQKEVFPADLLFLKKHL